MHGISVALLALAVACLTLACGAINPPSHVTQHWGEAYGLNMAAMVENPEAGSSQPVEGLDPVTGEAVAQRYYQSQTQQSAQDVRTILVAE